jgi:hypothetical protein
VTMAASDLSLHSSQLRSALLPLLLGRVFHVTRRKVCEQILAEGVIRANTDGALPTVFGSSNSFFRKRGCVSFFDYRSATAEQIEAALGKCSPYHLPSSDPELLNEPNVSYLFLSEAAHDRLISWSRWKEEEAYSDKVVPWVETGYPGEVPLTFIERVLHVTIDYPADSLAAMLHRARRSRENSPDIGPVAPGNPE